eukprot:9265478-Pyramimonas_sp.AAC.1
MRDQGPVTEIPQVGSLAPIQGMLRAGQKAKRRRFDPAAKAAVRSAVMGGSFLAAVVISVCFCHLPSLSSA